MARRSRLVGMTMDRNASKRRNAEILAQADLLRFVVRVTNVPKEDPDEYLLDGFHMTFTPLSNARRFDSRKEAMDYVVENGWTRKDNGLKIVTVASCSLPPSEPNRDLPPNLPAMPGEPR